MNEEIRLEFGTFEDRVWVFNITGYDLINVNLLSQIRDDAGVLLGAFTAIVVTPTQFNLAINAATSGAIPPGTYKSDVYATSTATGLSRHITPVFDVVVIDRVTQPV